MDDLASGFKQEESGSISFYLGRNLERDTDGTLCIMPQKYIEHRVHQYQQMFVSKAKTNVTSPHEKSDDPEIDVSELLDAEGT